MVNDFYHFNDTIDFYIYNEDIDFIVGCAYWEALHNWCEDIFVEHGELHGDELYQQISLDGTLVFYIKTPFDRLRRDYYLNRRRLIEAIRVYVSCRPYCLYHKDGRLRLDGIDAEMADVIVQYALFGSVLYGHENAEGLERMGISNAGKD